MNNPITGKTYVAEPTAQRFHEDVTSRVRGILGPFGSGKSVACVHECLHMMLGQYAVNGVRRSRGLVIRNTFPQLKSTTIRTWQAWIPERMCSITFGSPIEGHVRTGLNDGTQLDAEIFFLPLDKPRSLANLLSLEYTWLWVNEASQVPWLLVDTARDRIPRYPETEMGGPYRYGMIMDTNPPHLRHWWRQKFEIEQVEGWAHYRQPGALIRTRDGKYVPNPQAENIRHLPTGYAYYYEMIPGKKQDAINVRVMGEYGNIYDGLPVYDGSWHTSLYVPEQPLDVMRGLPLYLGWDFGLSPCAVLCQLSPRGQLRLLREYTSENVGIRQLIENVVRPAIAAEFSGMTLGMGACDPAGVARMQSNSELSCLQELINHKFPTVVAATQDFVMRRQSVENFMNRLVDGEPGLVVDKSCRVFIEGAEGGYRFERLQVGGSEERYSEKAHKNHPTSDLHDAFQYLCMHLDPRSVVKRDEVRLKSPPRVRLEGLIGV